MLTDILLNANLKPTSHTETFEQFLDCKGINHPDLVFKILKLYIQKLVQYEHFLIFMLERYFQLLAPKYLNDNRSPCAGPPCAININTNSSYFKTVATKIKSNPFSKRKISLLSQFQSPRTTAYNE